MCGKIVAAWAALRVPTTDFDVGALHSAIDEQRIRRNMSWKAVAEEVNRSEERRGIHPISPSTISGLKNKRWGVEGDGVLRMLLWLDRSPESFVPGHPGAAHPNARLPRVSGEQILRFDVPLIYSKLDALRTARGLTWEEVASEIGGICNAEQLKNMRKRQRTSFPQVMRLARWLRCPAAALTRMTRW
jgi:transcriptional regulator with XRE-family HTH domain